MWGLHWACSLSQCLLLPLICSAHCRQGPWTEAGQLVETPAGALCWPGRYDQQVWLPQWLIQLCDSLSWSKTYFKVITSMVKFHPFHGRNLFWSPSCQTCAVWMSTWQGICLTGKEESSGRFRFSSLTFVVCSALLSWYVFWPQYIWKIDTFFPIYAFLCIISIRQEKTISILRTFWNLPILKLENWFFFQLDVRVFKKPIIWASLVAQWLRIRLPMQGARVRSLVREDPTCRGTTKPVHHSYWAWALEPMNHSYWARVPQLLSPHA